MFTNVKASPASITLQFSKVNASASLHLEGRWIEGRHSRFATAERQFYLEGFLF